LRDCREGCCQLRRNAGAHNDDLLPETACHRHQVGDIGFRAFALRIYKKSIVKFKEGVSGSLELNTTQQQFFTAEGTYFNALMALVTAKAKLDNLLTKNAQ
jgi:hypothetical protein